MGGVALGLAAGLGYAAYAVVSSRMIKAAGSVTAVIGVLFGGRAGPETTLAVPSRRPPTCGSGTSGVAGNGCGC